MDIPDKSKMSGISIQDAELREKAGVLVLAIRRKGEKDFIYGPSANEKIQGGDTLILLGDLDQLRTLEELFKP